MWLRAHLPSAAPRNERLFVLAFMCVVIASDIICMYVCMRLLEQCLQHGALFLVCVEEREAGRVCECVVPGNL